MVWAEKMMADIMRVGYFGRSFGKDGLRNRNNKKYIENGSNKDRYRRRAHH